MANHEQAPNKEKKGSAVLSVLGGLALVAVGAHVLLGAHGIIHKLGTGIK
jgi:hypothetical protein